ncbi:helix-turn-helix domain-containing protein [bacterium]|nr:MAG: helix-turn-helix domain-containing protein [bacterium]
MRMDRVALDLPYYDGLLAGHHDKESGHASRRAGGTDDWLLVATLSGAGRFNTSLGEMPALPGSLTLVSPGTPHDYGTAREAEGWEILWVHFHPPPEWLEYLHWPPFAPGIATFSPKSPQEILAAFREVYRLTLSTSRRRRELGMNALERLLLLCEAQLPELGHPMDDRIRAVIEYIHGHLRTPLSLESLSEIVHLSPSRFSHLFRAEVGMPPLQYVGLQRIGRAQTLLERTTLSVSEIAAEVGMEPFHFSARFKAHTGSSPRNYRYSAFS